MSDETQRLRKIANKIKRVTKLKEEPKIHSMAQAVDELAKLLLENYLSNNK